MSGIIVIRITLRRLGNLVKAFVVAFMFTLFVTFLITSGQMASEPINSSSKGYRGLKLGNGSDLAL